MESPRLRLLLDSWVNSLKPTTRRAYQGDLTSFAAWLDRPDPASAAAWLFSLEAGDANLTVLRYRGDLAAKGASSATVARHISALRSLNTAARMTGLCPWTLEVKGPKVEAFRDTAGPGAAGWAKMKRAATADPSLRGFRDRALLLLLHDLGLRRGEAGDAAGLDLEHVERDDEGLPVAAWVHGKGRSDRSRLTVPTPTGRALLAWIDRRGPDPGPLFYRLDNAADGAPRTRLTGQAIADVVERIGKAAGLTRKVRPHGLRHVAITQVLDANGGDLRAAARFSRHANVQTVVRYDDNRQDVAGVMAAMIAE